GPRRYRVLVGRLCGLYDIGIIIPPVSEETVKGRHAQGTGDTGLFGSDNAGKVEDVGDIVVAVFLRNIVPDRLADQRGVLPFEQGWPADIAVFDDIHHVLIALR